MFQHIARRRILPNLPLSSLTNLSVKQFFSTMTIADYPIILTERPAVCNLVPPGQCQFNGTFQSVPLLDRTPCGTGGTSYLLRFGLPDDNKPMDLTTCACLLANVKLMDNEKKELVDVIRPYTPISANNQVGCFDLLIKDYGENGWLSKYMCEDLPIGGM